MASYFNIKKLRRQSKQHDAESHDAPAHLKSPRAPAVSTPSEEPAASPVLDEEDEKFLERLAAIAQEPEGTPPPLPTRPTASIDRDGQEKVGKDTQEALLDGADRVPLPMSPQEVAAEDGKRGKEKDNSGDLGRKKSVMSYLSRFKKASNKDKDQDASKEWRDKDKKKKTTDKDRAKAASSLHDAAEAAKSAEAEEVRKEEQDLTEILDQLNLSAVNNRVFSFSKESEELLNKFKLVLKDVINGAPHAYNDLEKLFTDYEGQLKKMYGSLPPFLQNLVKGLPAKMTAVLGPEIMAAQAEKPGFDAKVKAAGKAAGKAGAKKAKIPSLKSLISAEGAVAAMLRSILNFLKLRFPALMTGTNVLLSLAVLLLMFVFWYCHKRGRETRLEKERLDAEEADSTMASSASSFTDDGDSVFGEKAGSKSRKTGESSKSAVKQEEPKPPLIISDGKDAESERPSATVEDMPSVSHLPDPKSVPLPEPGGDTPAREEPLEVSRSK